MIDRLLHKIRLTADRILYETHIVEQPFIVEADPTNFHVPQGAPVIGPVREYETTAGLDQWELKERADEQGALPAHRRDALEKVWHPVPGELVGLGEDEFLRMYQFKGCPVDEVVEFP